MTPVLTDKFFVFTDTTGATLYRRDCKDESKPVILEHKKNQPIYNPDYANLSGRQVHYIEGVKIENTEYVATTSRTHTCLWKWDDLTPDNSPKPSKAIWQSCSYADQDYELTGLFQDQKTLLGTSSQYSCTYSRTFWSFWCLNLETGFCGAKYFKDLGFTSINSSIILPPSDSGYRFAVTSDGMLYEIQINLNGYPSGPYVIRWDTSKDYIVTNKIPLSYENHFVTSPNGLDGLRALFSYMPDTTSAKNAQLIPNLISYYSYGNLCLLDPKKWAFYETHFSRENLKSIEIDNRSSDKSYIFIREGNEIKTMRFTPCDSVESSNQLQRVISTSTPLPNPLCGLISNYVDYKGYEGRLFVKPKYNNPGFSRQLTREVMYQLEQLHFDIKQNKVNDDPNKKIKFQLLRHIMEALDELKQKNDFAKKKIEKLFKEILGKKTYQPLLKGMHQEDSFLILINKMKNEMLEQANLCIRCQR